MFYEAKREGAFWQWFEVIINLCLIVLLWTYSCGCTGSGPSVDMGTDGGSCQMPCYRVPEDCRGVPSLCYKPDPSKAGCCVK
jgi:hypothetical protein